MHHAGLDSPLPRIILGTASLFNVGSRRRREYFLDEAIESGFSHFDTAPYYGFGLAELDLGELARRSKKFSVTSKVGIFPPNKNIESDFSVFGRKALGKVLPALSRPIIDFSIAAAERSLDASLKRLNREQIEIYLLHEPRLSWISTDEWQKWLELQVSAGKVGRFGLAGALDQIMPIIRAAPALCKVLQVQDSIKFEAGKNLLTVNRIPDITYGYISSAANQGLNMPVSEVIKAVLDSSLVKSFIYSTRKSERLKQFQTFFEGWQ